MRFLKIEGQGEGGREKGYNDTLQVRVNIGWNVQGKEERKKESNIHMVRRGGGEEEEAPGKINGESEKRSKL